MRKAMLLLALCGIVCFVPAIQAQTPAPKPDPAITKLQSFVGHWTYEGESKAGPLGPDGKITGVQDAQMILGGFFLETRQKEKGPMGEIQSIEIDAYDPANKNFSYSIYEDGGGTESGGFTSSGNTWKWSGKYAVGGKEYLSRGTSTFAADLRSFTQKAEISIDGKTWLPSYEYKAIKTKFAPPK